MGLKLHFHLSDPLPIDASPLLPQHLLHLGSESLLEVRVSVGNQVVPLGELCRLSQSPESQPDELCFSGNTRHLHRVGMGMQSGRIVIEGDSGSLAGANMSGGELLIHGQAGDLAGAGMKGGLLQVFGHAGDEAGANLVGNSLGMQGGVLLIHGDAGREAGRRMRRGLIFIDGQAGPLAGADMRAGTLLVTGSLGQHPGIGMRRGSLVASRLLEPPLGFLPAGAASFIWLRIYLKWLAERGCAVPETWREANFHRLAGSTAEINKGEILIYDPN